MWNVSLTDILAAKEELTGRRAAVKARYEKDMQAIEDDLRNVLALENAANVFLKSHKQEDAEPVMQENSGSSQAMGGDIAALVTEIVAEPTEERQSDDLEAADSTATPAEPAEFSLERKVNRWRIR